MKHDFTPYIDNGIFIETGSFIGDGIQAALNSGFKNIISIELVKRLHYHCKHRFVNNKGVQLFLGDTLIVLPEIMKVIKEPCTFWLDAHFCGGDTGYGDVRVPILQELEIIGKHYIKTHTILIDDMRAVQHGFPNDGWNELTIDMLKEAVLKINPDYEISFDFGVVENDILVAQIKRDWIHELPFIKSRIFSQRYQDGIIRSIFENIGVTNKFCVEFGFNSNVLTEGSGSNVARLVLEDGWDSLLLDADFENKEINLHKEILTEDNIAGIFKKYTVPLEPDYISIDVDSIDLWLMKAILGAGYKPRVISIEYNANFTLGLSYTVKQGVSWEKDAIYGASLSALNEVAKEFGYSLIAVEKNLDLFFVRNDQLDIPAPPVNHFINMTGLPMHNSVLKERYKCFVEYPSMEEITEDLIESMPNVFRIKKEME